MITICNLSNSSKDSFIKSDLSFDAHLVFYFLKSVEEDYPDIKEWFYSRVLSGLELQERHLAYYMIQSEIVGLGIAKNDGLEKKICTLKVHKDYQCKGIGRLILTDMINWLADPKPLITVNENKYPEFEKLFSSYNFKKTKIVEGLYKPGIHELIFNSVESNIN
mgnify:CR=1 FL=1